jgi:hypothetical protein
MPIKVGLGIVTGEGNGTVVPLGGRGAGLATNYPQSMDTRQDFKRAYFAIRTREVWPK